MVLEPFLTLYHGTTEDVAETLLSGGWEPGMGAAGANQGNPRFLYLTSIPENALWFAEQKGGSTVLMVQVPLGSLIVDPEDGMGESVEEEFEIAARNGTPANFACTRPIPASWFFTFETSPAP